MHRFEKWRHALGLAPDAKTLGELIQEYVRSIPAEETEKLPTVYRMILGDPSPDIQNSAVTLLQAEMSYSGSGESADLLHEIAQTFAAASIRLGQVHGRTEVLLPRSGK